MNYYIGKQVSSSLTDMNLAVSVKIRTPSGLTAAGSRSYSPSATSQNLSSTGAKCSSSSRQESITNVIRICSVVELLFLVCILNTSPFARDVNGSCYLMTVKISWMFLFANTHKQKLTLKITRWYLISTDNLDLFFLKREPHFKAHHLTWDSTDPSWASQRH